MAEVREAEVSLLLAPTAPQDEGFSSGAREWDQPSAPVPNQAHA